MCQKKKNALVRALVKFVKFMHDNKRTTKVAKKKKKRKACHSSHSARLVFEPAGLRYGGDKLSSPWLHKGFNNKIQ